MQNRIMIGDMYHAAAIELLAKVVPERTEPVPDGRGGYKCEAVYSGDIPEMAEINLNWNGINVPFRSFIRRFIQVKRDWINKADNAKEESYE